MPILGAHMSIAGGYHKAVDAAADLGMDTVQLFTKNNNQWKAKPIASEEAAEFQKSIKTHSLSHPLSHSSYLINLASADDLLWQKSIDAFVEELSRATLLGIPFVVVHPGSHTTITEAEGLERVVDALDEVHRQTDRRGAQCLLETTAGQGSCLGWRFEQLGEILRQVKDSDRLGICFDTCHVFAAGYPLSPTAKYRSTWRAFDKHVGIDRIRAFHLNDSKREMGSRVDRHEHIGEGKLGLEPFRLLLRDRKFRNAPMYLETAKGKRDGEELDAINLRVLRSLMQGTLE